MYMKRGGITMLEFFLELIFEILFEIIIEFLSSLIKNKWVTRILNIIFVIVLLLILGSLMTFGSYLITVLRYKEAAVIFGVFILLIVGVIVQIRRIIRQKEEERWNFLG